MITSQKSGGVHVLYVDHQGHPAPLSVTYHATGTRRLSSSVERYPPSTLTEIDSAYCPQSLSFHDAASAAREGYSSKASSQRCPLCFNALSMGIENNKCFYKCGTCSWDSIACGLTQEIKGTNKVELARALEDLGAALFAKIEASKMAAAQYSKALTNAWDQKTKQATQQNAPDGPEGWSVEILEASLESKKKLYKSNEPSLQLDTATEKSLAVEYVDLDGDAPIDDTILQDVSQAALEQSAILGFETPKAMSDLLPLPMPYRVRESRRCRAELEEGRPGILLKPKLNPLEGDSSLRSGHGQWWKKDSSAIHVMPRIGVLEHEIHDCTRVLLLKVTNPTLGPMRLRFASSQYKGEENQLDDSSDLTLLKNVLLDELFQVYAPSVQLDTMILQNMKRTESVELLSAEDSFLEMGGKSREIPDAVKTWKFDPSSIENGSAMRLVASSASTAFFELTLANANVDESSSLAVALAVELEVGNGSWESSLIQKQSSGSESDWVPFDLVIAWT